MNIINHIILLITFIIYKPMHINILTNTFNTNVISLFLLLTYSKKET